MKCVIIVHQMKTNNISSNGNINFGSTVQNSHTSNVKVVGSAFAFGDSSNVEQSGVENSGEEDQ